MTYSNHALQVVELSQKLDVMLWSDPNWSLLEAALQETPIGEVHLHWFNHRGRGNWRLVTKWRGGNEICKTARCRVVTITPHGGENEAVEISRQTFDQAFSNWLNNKRVEGIMKHDVENAIYVEREKKKKEAERLLRIDWPVGEQRRWEREQSIRLRERREAIEREWPSAEADLFRGRRHLKRIAELDEANP